MGNGLKDLGSRFGNLVSGLFSWKTALAATLGPLAAVYAAVKGIGSLNSAAETVDKLGKASARLGIGVEQLSALRFAAKEADVDFDSLAKLIGKQIDRGEISIGAREYVVWAVKGRPSKVNETGSATGTLRQLCYDRDTYGIYRTYIYIRNDRVSSWQKM